MEELLLTKDNSIATITLNRPEKFNAMTTDMWRRLPEVIEEVRNDDNLKVLIITGAGRAFCAGSDAGRLASRISGEEIAKTQKELTAPVGAEVLCLAKLQKHR